jgi:CHAD domain-containing protein
MEIEAKFRIPDEQTFQRLLETTALAKFGLGKASVAELHDRYLDTADADIQAGGYACRLRRSGNQYLATLKSLGGATGAIHRRTEHELELSGPLPPGDWPPGTARDLVLDLSHGKPLATLFDIEQTRHARTLYDGDQAVAEVNLDRVCMRQGQAIVANYLEFEAELLPEGSVEDIEQLSLELQTAWAVMPESQSKFERGLDAVRFRRSNPLLPPTTAEMGPAQVSSRPKQESELLEAPGIEPDDAMSEAGRKTFRFHFQRMLYHEPGTRLGEDIEALHDMRVATRRMRAAFRVFGDHFRPKHIAPYLKGLRRTGRALGRVRDLDVFRERIHAYLETLPESERGGLDSLQAALEEQRESARREMLAYLDGNKYHLFVERFGEFVETEGLGSLLVSPNGDKPRPYRVRHVAPMAIYERLAAVRAYDEWVSIPNPPLTRLHALRIACKRLRYTLEFFSEVLGPDTKALIKTVVGVQDHLGALQDAVVASNILRDFLIWGTWDHGGTDETPPQTAVSAPGVETYLVARRSELQHLVETFPPLWSELNGPGFSRLVAEAVVVL